jgi:hypothetical protein
MSNHYGFFSFFGNDTMHNRFSNLMSTTSYGGHVGDIKGGGTYICQGNVRQCLAVFNARALIQQTWINDQDRYLTPGGVK